MDGDSKEDEETERWIKSEKLVLYLVSPFRPLHNQEPYNDEKERTILKTPYVMKNKTELAFEKWCTDKFISTIAKDCQKLTKLVLYHSEGTTDESIDHLIKCKNLIDLQLDKTKITYKGVSKLLIAIPTITRLQAPGMLEALELIDSKLKSGQTLNLKQLLCSSWDETIALDKHLDLIVKLCPKLTSLCLNCRYIKTDLIALTTLENLTDLSFHEANFYKHKVPELLEKKDWKIIQLNLHSVVELDFEALFCIGEISNLENLSVEKCKFHDNERGTWNRPMEKLFVKLKFLHCNMNYMPVKYLEFLLLTCHNVTNLSLGIRDKGLTDEIIEHAVCINEFKKLETLNVREPSNLSMKTVELLLQIYDRYKKLKVLLYFKHFTDIEIDELNSLKERINRKNINLDIYLERIDDEIYVKL